MSVTVYIKGKQGGLWKCGCDLLSPKDWKFYARPFKKDNRSFGDYWYDAVWKSDDELLIFDLVGIGFQGDAVDHVEIFVGDVEDESDGRPVDIIRPQIEIASPAPPEPGKGEVLVAYLTTCLNGDLVCTFLDADPADFQPEAITLHITDLSPLGFEGLILTNATYQGKTGLIAEYDDDEGCAAPIEKIRARTVPGAKLKPTPPYEIIDIKGVQWRRF